MPAQVSGTILLPKGAKVVSAVPSGDVIAVTVERDGGVIETLFFDATSHAPRGRLGFAPEP